MDEFGTNRRRLLALAGTGLAGAIAGCTMPQSDRSIPGDSSSDLDIDPADLPEEAVYSRVYEAIIDSVVQIQAFGVQTPLGDEGEGQGSGFLVDSDGSGSYVVTNEHVVYGADTIDVQYINGDWTDSTLLGTDFHSDLAVLEVDHTPSDALALELSEESPVPGQEVLAVGTPFGLEGSVSQGIVSGVDRSVQPPGRNFSFPNVVQTDAAVNPGNSGGPLVDLEGDVVGVVNAQGGENIGFAISAALSRRVVPALVEDGSYEHSYLGIGMTSVTRTVAEENELDEATGILVTAVEPNGPAAGVLEGSESTVGDVPVGGDVIYEIDGEPIPDRHALGTHLALETSPEETVELSIRRNGTETTETITLGSRPEPS